jgi:hypothetical protein
MKANIALVYAVARRCTGRRMFNEDVLWLRLLPIKSVCAIRPMWWRKVHHQSIFGTLEFLSF